MADEIKKEEAPVVNENLETKEEQKIVKPKFFFSPDEKIRCVVTGFYGKESGQLEFCVPNTPEMTDRFICEEHVFEFTRVPYDVLNRYREQSVVFNPETRTNSVNVLKLRDFFWLFHLTDWNFTDGEGKKIELKRDPNGALADESLDLLYQIPASILDTAIGLFERRINIA